VSVVQNIWSFAVIPKAAHRSKEVGMKMSEVPTTRFHFRTKSFLLWAPAMSYAYQQYHLPVRHVQTEGRQHLQKLKGDFIYYIRRQLYGIIFNKIRIEISKTNSHFKERCSKYIKYFEHGNCYNSAIINHTEIAVTKQSHTRKYRTSTVNETFNTQILHIP